MTPRTGSLTLMADGHYRVRLSLPDGSRPVVHLPPGLSEAEAQAKSKELAEKVWNEKGSFTKGPRPIRLLKDILDAWLVLIDRSKKAPATKAARHSAAKRLRKVLGGCTPEELSPGRLRTFLRSLEDEGLSPSRIGQVWTSLGMALDCAMGEEWISIPANPCRHPGMKGQVPAVPPPEEIVTLSDADVAILLSTPRRLRYLIALTSGLRDGELSALTWASLRRVDGVLCYDVKRSLEPNETVPKDVKTPASRRLVPVHSAVEAALYRPTDIPIDSPIFPGPGGAFLRPRSYEDIQEDLGRDDVTFHATRRTFSMRLDRAGVPGELADRLLGHASKSTRVRHYTPANLQAMKAAVEAAWLELPRHLPPPSVEVHEPDGIVEDPAAGRIITHILGCDVNEVMSADPLELEVLGGGVEGPALTAPEGHRGSSWQMGDEDDILFG